jgi:thioester reductase-like protein
LHQGYSESKWVAENLLSAAREELGVSSAILRVGQIAGPVYIQGKGGVWNKSEWFPSLVSSCGYLGVVPDSLPGHSDVRWVPVDRVAEIVRDLVVGDCLSLGKEGNEAWTRYYHVCNPREGNWGDLVGIVKSYLERKLGKEVKVVGFGEWVERLEDSVGKEEDVERNLGVKLLNFYRGMRDAGKRNVVMDTKETQKKSRVMTELDVVNGNWMKLWLERLDF